MDYKVQYINDNEYELNYFPYQDNNTGLNRVSDIYQTARRGRVGADVCQKLLDQLSNISNNHNQIPDEQINFNKFASKHIKILAKIISNDNFLKFGISQKIFNLFMKDLWAWNKLSGKQEKVLHWPIDRFVLGLLHDAPWGSWTKIVTTNENFNNTFEEYLFIQKNLKSQLRIFPIFETAIEMEQFFWHGFEYREN